MDSRFLNFLRTTVYDLQTVFSVIRCSMITPFVTCFNLCDIQIFLHEKFGSGAFAKLFKHSRLKKYEIHHKSKQKMTILKFVNLKEESRVNIEFV